VPDKWDGKTCPVCGVGTLQDGVRPESVEYRGRTFKSNQRGAYCDTCSDGVVYDDPAEERLWVDFRARVDAEQAAELAAIRRRLGLTQEQASKLTGGGHNAFSRYERQEVQPVMAVVNLFRLLGNDPVRIGEILPEAALPIQVTAGTIMLSSLPVAEHAEPYSASVSTWGMHGVIGAFASHSIAYVAGIEGNDVPSNWFLAIADVAKQRAPRSTKVRLLKSYRKQA